MSDRTLQDYVDAMEVVLDRGVRPGHDGPPAALLPHLYVGGISNAEDYTELCRLGITHVLNCAAYKGQKSYDGSPYEGTHIKYQEFPAQDNDYYNIAQHFQESFKFIDKAKRRGGSVLVHCAQGINRSVAVCVAYLMWHQNMTLLTAVSHAQRKRGSVLSNRGFQMQLARYAKRYGFLDAPAEIDRILPPSPKKKKSMSKKSEADIDSDGRMNKRAGIGHGAYDYGVKDCYSPVENGGFRSNSNYSESFYPMKKNGYITPGIENATYRNNARAYDPINRTRKNSYAPVQNGNFKSWASRRPSDAIMYLCGTRNSDDAIKYSYGSRDTDLWDYSDKSVSTGTSIFEEYFKNLKLH